MPIRNEAAHLSTAVAAVTAQDYPGRVRIYLGVGPSDDGTEQVADDLAVQLAADGVELSVVPNPSGRTPAALNVAIRAGHAPIVVRVDGHSELSDGYIQRAVTTMQQQGAVNVGGLQVPVASTPFEQAVAEATTSWLGTGGASYRVGGEAGPVDTVFLGVFDRAAIEAVGLFDEQLIRNQDYELNIRLRQAGGTVWFDPELSVGYRPRGTWKALARQYFEYGQWKSVVMRRYPESARLRQVVPVVAIGAVVASTVLSVKRPLLALAPLAYVAALATTPGTSSPVGRLRRMLALATIHIAWSSGVVRGAATPVPRDPG